MHTRGGRCRLATMMALVYAVQGAFWPLLAVHLHDLGLDGRARGWIFATMAIASMLVPLGAGQFVDRLMSTERFLALSYLLGAVILAVVAGGWLTSTQGIFLIFLGYFVIVAPSYGLSNSLAMRHLKDPGREFGGIRLWGTVGWMAVGWVVSLVMVWSGTNQAGQGAHAAFMVAAALALVLAGYALTLPHTPPLAVEGAGTSLREGLAMLRERDVRVLLLVSFGVYLTTPLVYQVIPGYLEFRGLHRSWVPTAMTLGQWPEVAALAVLPWLIGRFGYKGTLALGIAAWVARFSSLLTRPSLVVAVAGGLLHGVGVACFTVAGQVYLDGRAPARLRASTQGLYLVLTSGVGSFLGNLLAGEIVRTRPTDDVLVFLIPCVIDGAMLTYFLTRFRSRFSTVDRAGAPRADLLPRPHPVRGTVGCLGNLVTEPADG